MKPALRRAWLVVALAACQPAGTPAGTAPATAAPPTAVPPTAAPPTAAPPTAPAPTARRPPPRPAPVPVRRFAAHLMGTPFSLLVASDRPRRRSRLQRTPCSGRWSASST
ncbi:MAG: hypothetical protein R3F43_26890 [bacterium]